jgi:hypothetical protein
VDITDAIKILPKLVPYAELGFELVQVFGSPAKARAQIRRWRKEQEATIDREMAATEAARPPEKKAREAT